MGARNHLNFFINDWHDTLNLLEFFWVQVFNTLCLKEFFTLNSYYFRLTPSFYMRKTHRSTWTGKLIKVFAYYYITKIESYWWIKILLLYIYISLPKKSNQEKHMGIFFSNSWVCLVGTRQHKYILTQTHWVWLALEPATVGLGNMPRPGRVRSRQH